ncbi:MAG TPA: hypothetical protein VGV59_11985 [Pyrinomonadaceae bacterium]|nr:hypothetical protein [Pyrinomonadaceae bacterium]
MSTTNKPSQIYSHGLRQLRISELLLEEALAKQASQEVMESLELRRAALAYEYEGLALLSQALREHRKAQHLSARDGATPTQTRPYEYE